MVGGDSGGVDVGEGIPGRGITRLLVKQAGMALPDPQRRPQRTVSRPAS